MKLPFIFARRFVAGETFHDSVPKITRLNDAGIAVTLDLLGENVSSRTVASGTADDYIHLIKQIEHHTMNASISVKLTMMGLDIDTEFCTETLFRLLDATRENNQFVRIDMEGSNYTSRTIEIFKKAHQEYGADHVGIVLQAYLHRTREDVKELSGIGADIRLCKGAYKEPPMLALQQMPDIREAYKEYAKVLLHGTARTRIATHDDTLVEWVKQYMMEQDINKSNVEFQMLYGLREETMVRLTADGYQTRVYVPYGTMWFPYYRRRLMERKENIFFIAKTLFKK